MGSPLAKGNLFYINTFQNVQFKIHLYDFSGAVAAEATK